MYEFWYDYIKPKYGEQAKYYMDTYNFIVSVKTGDIYKDIAEDVGTRFDTLYFKTDWPLHKRKKSNCTNER